MASSAVYVDRPGSSVPASSCLGWRRGDIVFCLLAVEMDGLGGAVIGSGMFTRVGSLSSGGETETGAVSGPRSGW
jgi:hypothetical protein